MKTEIIAEIGANWEGSIPKAQKIIQECKNAGATAVKFQMWRADDLYPNHPEYKLIKKSELTFIKAEKLKKFADKIGIEFFCSVFFPEAIDFLESLKVKRYKIASRTCLFEDPFSLETLKRLSQVKKPVIISMGMGGDKKYIKKIFSKNKIIFCYCISEYQLDFKKIKWNEINTFNGFSDHTLGITAPIVFAILKKLKNSNQILIEKHVKLKNSKGPDASTSITTNELKEMISNINEFKNIKLV